MLAELELALSIICPEPPCKKPAGEPCSVVRWADAQGKKYGGMPSCHDARYWAAGFVTGTGGPGPRDPRDNR